MSFIIECNVNQKVVRSKTIVLVDPLRRSLDFSKIICHYILIYKELAL
jgi:hypothetical protein